MKQYSRTVTEGRAIALSTKLGWTIYGVQKAKINEEVIELNQAKTPEEIRNELSDIAFCLNSIAQPMGLCYEQLLDQAIDKNTKRLTDPNYMR